MKKIIALLALSTLLFSCEDVIQLDLPEGEKLIVINGLVTDSLPVWAEVYTTTNFNNNGILPIVSNATVLLFENNTQVSELLLDSNNRFSSNFIGTVGNSYHIQVSVPNSYPELGGTIWMSNQETMEATPPIDTIFQIYKQATLFEDEGIYVKYGFTDPKGIPNKYRLRFWERDTLQSTAGDLFITEDDIFDGQTFGGPNLDAIQINSNPAKNGEYYKVEQSSITKAYFEYLNLIVQQTTQVGGLFDPPPTTIKGNIFGLTRPNQLALGFFAASALATAELTVTE